MSIIHFKATAHFIHSSYIRCLLCLFGLFLFLWPAPAEAIRTEVHRYLQQSGDNSFYFDWILDESDGYVLRAISTFDEHRTVMDQTMAARQWNLTKPADDTLVEAHREGNRIFLSGRFRGTPLEKRKDIDGAPWFQSLSASLRSFLSSRQTSTAFWTIRPDKLTVHKVRATQKGTETLHLGEQKFETIKVEIRLTGIASLFGRAYYWFSTNDLLLLKYQGPKGLPGIPSTTITLQSPISNHPL